MGTTPSLPTTAMPTQLPELNIPKDYIVSGNNAEPHEFPYHVRLSNTYKGGKMCGGTIIHTLFILTAAHCLYNTNKNQWRVFAGDHNRYDSKGTEQNRTVSHVYTHEYYNYTTSENDLAVLVLSEPWVFNGYVNSISYLRKENPKYFAEAVVSGWGKLTDRDQYGSDILQKVYIPLVSKSDCQTKYSRFEKRVTNKMMCAGLVGKDACYGDSGGPLTCIEKQTRRKVLCGVVSFGLGCGRQGFPGVYMDISQYWQWFELTMAKHIHGKNLLTLDRRTTITSTTVRPTTPTHEPTTTTNPPTTTTSRPTTTTSRPTTTTSRPTTTTSRPTATTSRPTTTTSRPTATTSRPTTTTSRPAIIAGHLIPSNASREIPIRVVIPLNTEIMRDCEVLKARGHTQSGVYTIQPNGIIKTTINVYCDMKSSGGGWTIIQRRGVRQMPKTRRENFNRTWTEYENGFGLADDDHWIGLRHIHSLSHQCENEMKITVTAWNGTEFSSGYSSFQVAGADDNYRLLVGKSTGRYDMVGHNNGTKFSTFDNHNDNWSGGHCAVDRKGAWWHNYCTHVSLNGEYADDGANGAIKLAMTGIYWWPDVMYSHMKTEMKIRSITTSRPTATTSRPAIIAGHLIPSNERQEIAIRVVRPLNTVPGSSCKELRLGGHMRNGVYKIQPNSTDNSTINVYCDMEDLDGGWTIIQRRGVRPMPKRQRETFNRTWMKYESGFGSVDDDHWIGLQNIHSLTSPCENELKITLTAWNMTELYSIYSNFQVSGVDDDYRLTIGKWKEGTLFQDIMVYNNGMKFSTFDKDNDKWEGENCAAVRKGAWWYDACSHISPNGEYAEDGSNGTIENVRTGIYWWPDSHYSFMKSEMKIRHKC